MITNRKAKQHKVKPTYDMLLLCTSIGRYTTYSITTVK